MKFIDGNEFGKKHGNGRTHFDPNLVRVAVINGGRNRKQACVRLGKTVMQRINWQVGDRVKWCPVAIEESTFKEGLRLRRVLDADGFTLSGTNPEMQGRISTVTAKSADADMIAYLEPYNGKQCQAVTDKDGSLVVLLG